MPVSTIDAMYWLFAGLFALSLLAAPASACDGDCDGSGTVLVDEVLIGVRIALGQADLERCAAADRDGDGAVSITDLLAAVVAALDGCAVSPTPTPDPGLADCGDGTVNGSEECDDGNRISRDGCSADCALETGGDPCAGMPAFPGAAVGTVLVTDAVDLPVHVAAPRLDPRRVYVLEQRGRIRVVRDGALLDE